MVTLSGDVNGNRHPNFTPSLEALRSAFVAIIHGHRMYREKMIVVEDLDLQDGALLIRLCRYRCNINPALPAQQELRCPVAKHIPYEVLVFGDVNRQPAVRIRDRTCSMLSAKRALASSHLKLSRICLTLEGNLDAAAMATAGMSQIRPRFDDIKGSVYTRQLTKGPSENQEKPPLARAAVFHNPKKLA